MDFHQWGLVVVSYLAGGIPTGYLAVKKLKGIDIREYGSGNPGTANVYRVAGPLAGAITLVVDALKGFLPVFIVQRLHPGEPGLMMLCGAAAIIGHDWTVFLRFRGGKGVATSAGVFAAMMPAALGLSIAVFVLGILITGHISVGSMAAAVALPLLALAFKAPAPFVLMAAASGVLILYKHIPNIRRLLEKKELYLHGK